MNKLLLTLGMVTVAASLYGMEVPKKEVDSTIDYSKFSPISLPQTYHHLSQHLLPEIAQYILSLQIKESGINLVELPQTIEQSCKDPDGLVTCIDALIKSCGYTLSAELFKKYFPHEKISICDIENLWGQTALHIAVSRGYTETAKLLLNAAGDNAYTLLTMQRADGQTAFFAAAWKGRIEIVKLLLNAAGDNVQDYMAMKTKAGVTVFDVANGEVREVMKQYMQNKNQL